MRRGRGRHITGQFLSKVIRTVTVDIQVLGGT